MHLIDFFIDWLHSIFSVQLQDFYEEMVPMSHPEILVDHKTFKWDNKLSDLVTCICFLQDSKGCGVWKILEEIKFHIDNQHKLIYFVSLLSKDKLYDFKIVVNLWTWNQQNPTQSIVCLHLVAHLHQPIP